MDRAVVIYNTHPLDIRFERAFGAACDLSTCAAFDPGHTSPGYVAANNGMFFAYKTEFSHRRYFTQVKCNVKRKLDSLPNPERIGLPQYHIGEGPNMY